MTIKVLFRADASVQIGSGHVMRCVTLAERLREHGALIAFACRELPGDLNDWLRAKGFEVIAWIEDHVDTVAPVLLHYVQSVSYDWLVVDHYGLDARWERQMRPYVKQMMVIDDLADRPHDCDLLLDQNFFADPQRRYERLLPVHCQRLLGPEFALLRPAFGEVRALVRQSQKRETGVLKRIQVFFGGSDPTEETLPILQAIDAVQPGCWEIDVIVGASNPKQVEIRDWCAEKSYLRFYCQTPRMAELMSEADLAISAGGTATWERLCLGLPALVISVAPNQESLSAEVAAVGTQVYLGASGSVTPDAVAVALCQLAQEPDSLRKMSEKGMRLVDGHGTNRVALHLITLSAALSSSG